ncbi:MAG TPA: hypothetical protein VIJ66_04330 [Solirubrobacteraceae bacterium]
MIVLATIALGWLALMTLVVSSCRAARLGDQAQLETSAAPPPPPQPMSQPVRRRRAANTLAAAHHGRGLQRPV